MQTPRPGALNVDHVAHFVPEQHACREALVRLGFTPTPFSLQQHRTDPGAPLRPVGTGNHCVMLHSGYLEFLVPVAESEVAQQLQRAIRRYVGPHSIVFGTANAAADHQRLTREGFAPLPPIDLQRPIETPEGERTVRFTVVRVPPGTMAEGRIQFCHHHSEPLLWQPRWLEHRNGATGLAGVIVCVADVDEAAARYARFTGIAVERPGARVRVLRTERGWIRFCDADALAADLGVRPAVLPMIAGCEITVRDLDAARRVLEEAALPLRRLEGERIAVTGPPAIGGEFVFSPAR